METVRSCENCRSSFGCPRLYPTDACGFAPKDVVRVWKDSKLIYQNHPTMNDKVNSPSHYTSGGIEAIDYIQAKLGDDGCVSYCLGNVLKYVSRAGKKDISAETEDLKKAQWYLNKAISISEDNQNGY